jgi:hypothetical protein
LFASKGTKVCPIKNKQKKKERKYPTQKGTGVVTQVVECLPSKGEALSSSPVPFKKQKDRTQMEAALSVQKPHSSPMLTSPNGKNLNPLPTSLHKNPIPHIVKRIESNGC